MRIEPISVEAFTVHDAPAVDPVTVILRDLGEGKGRLIIECYCESWAGYWGAMGDRSLTKFLIDGDADYIANRIYPGGLSRGTRRYEYLVRIVRAMQAALKERAAPETSERLLARQQPCGCIVCTCDDDHRCQGCGAKHCGTHPVGELPNPRYTNE